MEDEFFGWAFHLFNVCWMKHKKSFQIFELEGWNGDEDSYSSSLFGILVYPKEFAKISILFVNFYPEFNGE